MGRFRLNPKNLLRAGVSAAAGNPIGAITAMTSQPQRQLTPADTVIQALADERVQQELAELVAEVLSALQGGGDAAPASPPLASAGRPAAGGPPREKWPYSTLYLPTLEQRIEQSEGKRLDVHLVENIRHVGIGHNCETDSIPDAEQQVGMRISEQLCAELFEDDLGDARDRAARACRHNDCELERFPLPVQDGLVNMAFQMGNQPARWSGLWRCLKAGEFAEAARESLRSGRVPGKPSGWWLQTPNRAAVVAPMLSDRQLWFEIGPETRYGDGTAGPAIIEHPWS